MASQGFIFPDDEEFLDLVREELRRARDAFPENLHQMTALQEEVGELSEALLEHTHGDGDAGDILHEAVQTAAMAVRVAVEGDHSFEYDRNGDAGHHRGEENLETNEWADVKKASKTCLAMERALREHPSETYEIRRERQDRGRRKGFAVFPRRRSTRRPSIGTGSSILLALADCHTYFRQIGALNEVAQDSSGERDE